MLGFAPVASFPVASDPTGNISLLGRITAQVRGKIGTGYRTGVKGKGTVQVRGLVGQQTHFALLARTFVQVKGRFAGRYSSALKGKTTAQVKGRAGIVVVVIISLQALMTVQAKGRLVAKAFLPRIIASTSFFWRRP